jgi:hypothetical protein
LIREEDGPNPIYAFIASDATSIIITIVKPL